MLLSCLIGKMSKPDSIVSSRKRSSFPKEHEQSRYTLKYLTPHKIVLLILIHAYCASSIPPSHQAGVITLLLEHVEKPTERDPPIRSLESRLSNIPSTLQYMDVYDIVLELAWSLDSFDDFHTFMMNITNCLASRDSLPSQFKVQRPLLTTSLLGRYVRRCHLEYIKLDYDEAELLWNLFKLSRASTAEYLGVDDKITSGGESDISESRVQESFEGPIVCTSQDGLEKLCQLEIDRSEKYADHSASDSQKKLADLMSTVSSVSVSAHFAKFRESVRSGDYFSAVAHIHSYFDHTITMQLSSSETINTYQFALFHLAVLHEQFHNYSDAAWAIREAINTARENKDNASLLFSLAWLHQFAQRARVRDKKEVPISREESLQYLKLKTKEANLHSLLGVVNLVEAQRLLRSGGSLISIFENVLKSSHINLIYNLYSSVGPQMTFQSALWSRLGNENLSSLYAEISYRHYRLDSLRDDVVRAQCVRAHQKFKEGHLRECFDIFDSMVSTTRTDFHARHLLEFYRTAAELRLAINRKRLEEATIKLENLKALQYYDVDTAIITLMGEIDVNVLQGNAEEALKLVREKFQKLNDSEGDIVPNFEIRAYGLKLGKPAKALSVLIHCVDLSEKYNARLVYLGAVCLLAKVMNEFRQAQDAYRILSAVMPNIIETKDRCLEASSYLTLAESLLLTNDSETTTLERAELFLEISQASFRSIGDVDGELSCLGNLASVFDKTGNILRRDAAARAFCELEMAQKG